MLDWDLLSSSLAAGAADTSWMLKAHSELVEICDVDLCLKRPFVTLVLLLETLNTLSWSLSFEAYLKTWMGP